MNPRPKARGVFERPRGSGIYWIQYFENGRRHREKVGRQSVAIDAYAKRKLEIREGKFFPPKRQASVTFAELAADALEHSKRHKVPAGHYGDTLILQKWQEWFKGEAASAIGPQVIEKRLSDLTTAGRSASTVNHYRSVLSLTFSLAVRNGKVIVHPVRQVRRLRENNSRVRFLEISEEKRLRAAVRRGGPLHELELDIALNTGMRRGEQYRLRWANVDSKRGIITIPRAKHGEKRHVPINSACKEALRRLRHRAKTMYVCPGWKGTRTKDQREWFERAVKSAGIEDFRWHDLRHTFASRLVMAGVDLRTVQELMGHKTMTMTLRYAHLAPQHQQSAVEKLVKRYAT